MDVETKKITIASTRKSAGKTSLICGITKTLQTKIGYLKPFGDRLFYRKKRLWDYDFAFLKTLFRLTDEPEDVTIGFDHSKLKYMYDAESIKEKLLELAAKTGQDKDILFVEGGKDLTYGISVHLDAISVAKSLDCKLVLVLSGTADTIVDDATFVTRFCVMPDIDFGGIIVNQVHDVRDFKDSYLDMITELGIQVLGILPYQPELTQYTVRYLAESMFAKVIAGEGGLDRIVTSVVTGAMSANVALRLPVFQKENKIVITGGDRSDMILAAMETNSAGIILTGNLTPPANLISKASDLNIPLLLVSEDTFRAAQHIDNMEVLISKDDTEKIDLLSQLVKKNINVNEITGN
ncbi:MAG: DRTGG domain-containing protein [Candidatus Heimdallarchaeota archaeon]